MLLLHQIGSVNVGEVVRYTVTYTPSLDRILPPPSHLHVKIKNTSAIPLRAAYLHGPYTLYVASYPSTYDPNKKHVTSKQEGEPAYEPQLKAGGQWSSKLTVPESIRQDAARGDRKDNEPRKSFTWIIEVASQVLFSTTASVHYELLVGRDEKSVSLGFTGVVSSSGAPGRLEDLSAGRTQGHHQLKGVFTKAVKLKVDDTTSLWNSSALPSQDDTRNPEPMPTIGQFAVKDDKEPPRKKRKKIHLVILTHGLHSNLGADMLYMKESIEATARQAREDARTAKIRAHKQKTIDKYDFGRTAAEQRAKSVPDLAVAPLPAIDEDNDQSTKADDEDDDDDEEVVVKGFKGNAVKTERGIQYLGKRLAKYVLAITYPDQPYLPVKSTITQSISRTFTGASKASTADGRQPSHKGSSIAKDESHYKHNLPYQITSISFVGHSLGGLIQTYAIAYIQKHSPEFFDKITPINFVAMASPFLGLSNENPVYVKFALDFGLVGRTGQDLGLTWRAPTIARNGWGAMVGGFSSEARPKEEDPGAKPLLRILPTGPAHVVLKRFRNRSVYSNVVNDGIVPLRTSCLLFLDWRGLGKVEKARRENGLVGTMVNWGVMELTGQNASVPRRGLFEELFSDSSDGGNKPSTKHEQDPGSAVPQAEAGDGLDEAVSYERDDAPAASQMLKKSKSPEQNSTLWSTLSSFFRPQAAGHQKSASPKQRKIYERGQTMHMSDSGSIASHETSEEPEPQQLQSGHSSPSNHRKLLVRGSSLYTNNSDNENLDAPPRTTVFESAGDLLNPPLPPKEYILDPAARPRTIFHDRVYHPEDIPPPPTKRQKLHLRSRPNTTETNDVTNQRPDDMRKIGSDSSTSDGGVRIEEKIARAYHKDMAWRKVLVRLEPDAHNNIIVRRMFANAYGWPVVKHMCDTHFGYTTAARTADEVESPVERAQPQDVPASKEGEEVRDQTQEPEADPVDAVSSPARATTTDNIPDKEDHVVDTLHLRHKNVQAAKQAEPKSPGKTRDVRSASELRESRDQVPDLVSMVSAQGAPSQSYSSMHSGTAALHRLARQDSARWSDRFFDSEEDEEDDENDLDQEWQKAYNRGANADPAFGPLLSESPRGSIKTSTSSKNPPSSRSTTTTAGPKPLPANTSTSQPAPQLTKTLVSEPEPITNTPPQPEPSTTAKPDNDPQTPPATQLAFQPDAQTLSLTGVGLEMSPHKVARKVEEQQQQQQQQRDQAETENSSTTGPAVSGISEQVARVRSRSISGNEGAGSRAGV